MPTVSVKPPPTGTTMHGQCPHDKAALVLHETKDEHAATFGALHCTSCGCCFKPDHKIREHNAACPIIDPEVAGFVTLED